MYAKKRGHSSALHEKHFQLGLLATANQAHGQQTTEHQSDSAGFGNGSKTNVEVINEVRRIQYLPTAHIMSKEKVMH